jgi:hypothetical protein
MLLKAGRSLALATLLAAGGVMASPALVDGPAFAQNGGGGDGGGGGGGGGSGGASGSAGLNDVYAVMQYDAQNRGRSPAAGNARGRGATLTHVRGPNNPHPPQRGGQYASMPGDHGGGCGGRGAVRIVYDINGEPLRYQCMPVR